MVESNYAKKAFYTAMGALILSGMAFGGAISDPVVPVQEKISYDKIDLMVQNAVKTEMKDITVTNEYSENPKVDEIYDEMFKIDAYEAYAETLIKDSLDIDEDNLATDKDLKEAIQDAINDYYIANNISSEVESYRDIEKISVKEIDIDVESGEDDVEARLELKVYYYIDGDEDKEDRVKARLFLDLNVKDAASEDEDDSEDAEVEDYNAEDIDVDKVY